MPNEAYWRWLNAGKPISGVMRPMRSLRDRLRAYGYTVYDIGNDDHMRANPPLDHTPFATTSWPTAQAEEWWLCALDVMPPTTAQVRAGLPTLQQLGQQIVYDRKAGLFTALKYMNWEPVGNYTGPCYQESWKPNYARYASSDRGHIHLSGRSDRIRDTRDDGYDPVARYRDRVNPAAPKPAPAPTPAPLPEENDMQRLTLGRDPETGALALGDGVQRRSVRADEVPHLTWFGGRCLTGPTPDPKAHLFDLWHDGPDRWIRDINLDMIGRPRVDEAALISGVAAAIGPAVAAIGVRVEPDQVPVLAQAIAAALRDDPANPMTDVDMIRAAVEEALASTVFRADPGPN